MRNYGFGFYYLSNAASRLAGKFLFGKLSVGGLPACLSATILCLLCWLFTFSLEILEEERRFTEMASDLELAKSLVPEILLAGKAIMKIYHHQTEFKVKQDGLTCYKG